MGRANKKKRHHNKSKKPTLSQEKKNELGILSDIESGNREMEQMSTMINLLSQQSYDEDLACVLATLSSFVLEEKGTNLFIKLNGTAKVSNLLLHSNADVREKAVGTLRNILIAKDDLCIDEYVANGVVVNLMVIFKEAYQALKEGVIDVQSTADKDQKTFSFLKDTLDLLTHLSEISPSIVDRLDLDVLLSFLVLTLENVSFNVELRIKAAQCLYVISEDNKMLADLVVVNYPQIINRYAETSDINHSLVSIYCMGIAYNFICMLPHENQDKIFSNIIQNVGQCLKVVAQMMYSETAEKDLENVFFERLEVLKIGLELLSNVICYDKDGSEEEWEDLDENEDEILNTDQKDIINDNTYGKTFIELLTQVDIPKNVISLCGIVQVESFKLSQASKDNRWLSVYNRSWQCLSNLVSIATTEMISQSELLELWQLLIKTVFLNENGELRSKDKDFLDAISSSMRAIIEKLILADKSEVVCPLNIVEMISSFLNHDIDESAKLNLISILGIIGKHICINADSSPILERIALVFSSILKSNTKDFLIAAEILDATFDSFADGPCVDQILISSGLLSIMKNIHVKLKSLTKEEKQNLGEKFGIIQMARTNLARFLKYKNSI